MKKVYLMAGALLFGAGAFAQVSQQATPVEADDAALRKGNIRPYNADRGTPFWTEDFANGLAGNSGSGAWTAGGADAAIWKSSVYGPSGCFSSGIGPIPSATAGNGFMLFDSDSSNCTNPATQAYTTDVRVAYIQSPVIDLSAQASANIEFDHALRFCCSGSLNVKLQVSNDGGTTFTDFPLATTTSANNVLSETAAINISGVAAGQANVVIRFSWDGNAANSHYFWMIDDINLVPSPADEVSLPVAGFHKTTPNIFGAYVGYTVIPDEQVHDVEFHGTMVNQGSTTAGNVQLTTEVLDGAMATVANLTGTASNVVVGDTLRDTTNTFTIPATLESYTGAIGFTYDNVGVDNDPSNNADTILFDVVDAEYGRDDNTYRGSGLWNGDDGGSPAVSNAYEMGPVYEMQASQDLYAVRTALTGSTDPGAFLFARIYQIDQTTGDFNLVYDGSGTAQGEIEITAGMISASPTITWVDIPIDQGNNMPLTLMAGEQYIVCIGHYGGPEAIVIMGGGYTSPAQSVFLLDGTDNTWYYLTSTPMIRCNFNNIGLGVEEAEIAGIELGQNQPNPFNGTTQINYSLDYASDVAIDIVDLTGKQVMSIDEGTRSAGDYQVVLNANEFAPGIYYYTLRAGEKSMTKKMVITK